MPAHNRGYRQPAYQLGKFTCANHNVWRFSHTCRFLMGIAAPPPAGKAAPERWISFCKVGGRGARLSCGRGGCVGTSDMIAVPVL